MCAENHFYILQLRKHKREINTKKESLCIRIWIGISLVYTQSETKTFIQLRCAPCVSWTQRLSCQLSVTASINVLFFFSVLYLCTFITCERLWPFVEFTNIFLIKEIKLVFFGNSPECVLKSNCKAQLSSRRNSLADEKGNSEFSPRKFSLSCCESIKAQN